MDPSHLQGLIDQYGYLAVFFGSLLEGETVLIMAGYAAHRGYMELGFVILIGTFGGFLGDQFFFTLGRARGRQLLNRFPAVEAQAARVGALVNRYNVGLIVGVRFLYGLRIAGPVLLGMSDFAIFNLLGALLWAILLTGAGYAFGEAFHLVLTDAKRYEALVFGVILLTGIALWIYRRTRRAVQHARGKA
jgi:membrane protein DedA with SNARE-associated domain